MFFCCSTEEIEPHSIGRFCLAKIEAGDTIMATVRRGYRDGTYNLSGPYSAESVRLSWATPIIITRM